MVIEGVWHKRHIMESARELAAKQGVKRIRLGTSHVDQTVPMKEDAVEELMAEAAQQHVKPKLEESKLDRSESVVDASNMHPAGQNMSVMDTSVFDCAPTELDSSSEAVEISSDESPAPLPAVTGGWENMFAADTAYTKYLAAIRARRPRRR